MHDAPVLSAQGLTRIHRRARQEIVVLRDASLLLSPGESVAITGPSGSGKTTLLHLLAGLDRPTRGTVEIAGTRLDSLDFAAATDFRRRHIGFVFQFFHLLPTMTARENVELPLLAEGLAAREIAWRAEEVLARVRLSDRADHRPDELSGGEQQRVGIARALALRPPLLLADEPTGNLDTMARGAILDLLQGTVERDGVSLVLVTHDLEAAGRMHRVLSLRDGTLHDLGPSRDLRSALGGFVA